MELYQSMIEDTEQSALWQSIKNHFRHHTRASFRKLLIRTMRGHRNHRAIAKLRQSNIVAILSQKKNYKDSPHVQIIRILKKWGQSDLIIQRGTIVPEMREKDPPWPRLSDEQIRESILPIKSEKAKGHKCSRKILYCKKAGHKREEWLIAKRTFQKKKTSTPNENRHR